MAACWPNPELAPPSRTPPPAHLHPHRLLRCLLVAHAALQKGWTGGMAWWVVWVNKLLDWRRVHRRRQAEATCMSEHSLQSTTAQKKSPRGLRTPPQPTPPTLIFPSTNDASLASSAHASPSTRHSRHPGWCSNTKNFWCSSTCVAWWSGVQVGARLRVSGAWSREAANGKTVGAPPPACANVRKHACACQRVHVIEVPAVHGRQRKAHGSLAKGWPAAAARQGTTRPLPRAGRQGPPVSFPMHSPAPAAAAHAP